MEDTTTETPDDSQTAPAGQRRAATPRAASAADERRGGFPWKSALLLILALGIGLAVGVLGMRARYHAKDVVVTVNGVEIDRNQFFDRLQRASGQEVMKGMVAEELQLQYARKQGVYPTPQEVDARFAEMARRPNFKENLTRRGIPEETFKRGLLVTMAQANVLTKGVSVTDAEVRKFYDANVSKTNPAARYYTPDLVQVAVIVTKTEKDAAAAISELNRGIPWQTVVQKYSVDDSKANAGILPPTLKGRTRASTIAGLEGAIFAMKVGERIGPRNFAGAWWIIRCLDKQPEATLKFEDVKSECVVGAKLVKAGPEAGKKVQAGFDEFQKDSKLKAFWPQYADAVKIE